MGETFEQMKNQLNSFWQGLNKNKKIMLGIGSFLIVVSLTSIIFFSTRTQYEVLYSDLSLKDAGLIAKKLDENNVKWKDANNGSTILVPSEMKDKLRMEMAMEGLPKEGYSFLDAFNDSSWTMTEYEKKQRNKYALENTLANNISEIDGIESAKVYLKIPESNDYVLKNNDLTTASVFVTLARDVPLTTSKVQGIQNLVASAVGMNPEDVSVVDDNGKLLSSSGTNQQGYDLTEQLNIQQNLQIRINESIKSFLENVFGYGNVVVRASVKVNFDSETTSIVQFSPPIDGAEEGLARSMEEIEEHMVNGRNGGVPGTDTNVQDAVTDYTQLEGGNSKYDKASRTINYELNEINKQIKKAPGQIDSITVAILVNEDSLVDGEMTEDKRKEISNLIYAATGLDTKQVQVSTIKFNNNLNTQDSQEADTDNPTTPWWVYLVIGLALAGTSSFIILRNRKKNNMEDINELIEQKASQLSDVEEIDFETEKSQVKEQIDKFVDKKPDSVAQLLRTWLNEE